MGVEEPGVEARLTKHSANILHEREAVPAWRIGDVGRRRDTMQKQRCLQLNRQRPYAMDKARVIQRARGALSSGTLRA